MTKVFYATAALGLLAASAAHAQVEDATTGGPYCREYQQTLTIAGKTQKGFGTACLQPDGSWELQNEPQQPAPQPGVQAGVPVPPANIGYYTEEGHVFVTPPEPFVVGTVFIGGHERRFGPDYRPYWHGDHHYWR